MAEYLTFHLVSPEKKLASVEAQTISIPGIEGDMHDVKEIMKSYHI